MVWLGRLTRLSTGILSMTLGAASIAASEAPHERTLAAAIPAAALADALAAYSSATHLQLVYVSQLALGKSSRGVPAGLAADAALAQLLQGTGLEFRFLNDRTVKLYEPPVPQARASAPTAATDESESPASTALEDVVVTANKRQEILSSVPMSITVIPAEALEPYGNAGIGGVAALTTGIEYDFSSQYGPGLLSNFFIRGINANKGDATTGVYVDDVPLQTPHTVFGNPYPVTFDTTRVEVLRGPQGVLFGRGAEGGAIRFVTNEPSTTTVSELYHAEVSSIDGGGTNTEMGAAIGGPLVDGVLGARASAWYRADGGYINRVDPLNGALVDPNANRQSSRAFRLAFAYEPNDAWRIEPTVSRQILSLHDSPAFFAAPDFLPAELDNGKLLRQPEYDGLTVGSLNVTGRLGATKLTSISAYWDRATSATVDQTNAAGIAFFGGFGNPLGPGFPTAYDQAVPSVLTLHEIQLSQELRLASADDSAPFRWLVGTFFSRLAEDSTENTYLITMPQNPGILQSDDNGNTERSLFGQINAAIDPRFSVGLGVRLGWFVGFGASHATGFANGPTRSAESHHYEFLPPAPRIDLSYQPDGYKLFYVVVAKGLRAGGGGYSGQVPTCQGTADPTSFAPDSVWSYELGTKDDLFDQRLRLDASVFDIHWHGIQERVQDACANAFTANAGDVVSKGVDLQIDALPIDRLNLTLTVGYLDVRYARTLSLSNGETIVDAGTVVGGVPSVPPPWTATAAARYTWPVSGETRAFVRAEEILHSHNPGPFTELDPHSSGYTPGLVADPATYLFNLQSGVERGGWNVRLFVNNLFNARPQLQRYGDETQSLPIYAYTLVPRTVGIMGTWSY